jgi:phage/plasmid-associated DNA primase
VLNKALDALPGLRANGFINAPSMQAAWAEFRQETDPIAVWLDGRTMLGPEMSVSKDALWNAYNVSARRQNGQAVTKNAFGRSLKELRPDLDEAQRMVAGKLTWCWLGIGLKDGGL